MLRAVPGSKSPDASASAATGHAAANVVSKSGNDPLMRPSCRDKVKIVLPAPALAKRAPSRHLRARP